MKTRYREMGLDFRVYHQINGVEVEVDLEEVDFNYKTQQFSGVGVVTEGPLAGYEIVLPAGLVEELVNDFEEEYNATLF
jgi:hypothetical protein